MLELLIFVQFSVRERESLFTAAMLNAAPKARWMTPSDMDRLLFADDADLSFDCTIIASFGRFLANRSERAPMRRQTCRHGERKRERERESERASERGRQRTEEKIDRARY